MSVTEQLRPATRKRSGPPPFGWEWIDGHLSPVQREQAIRWLIKHLHAEGWSVRRISGELERLRIPTRAGLRTWPRMTVQRVVAGGDPLSGSG